MSVNMIAASRRVSVCTALLGSSFIDTDYSADVALLSTVNGVRANAAHPPRPKWNLTCLLQTAIGPRSGWSDSLGSMALNGGQRFAFARSPSCLLPASWRTHFNPALRQAAN